MTHEQLTKEQQELLKQLNETVERSPYTLFSIGNNEEINKLFKDKEELIEMINTRGKDEACFVLGEIKKAGLYDQLINVINTIVDKRNIMVKSLLKNANDDDLTAVLTVKYLPNNQAQLEMTLLEQLIHGYGKNPERERFSLILEEIKGKKGVLKKVLLAEDGKLLHDAIRYYNSTRCHNSTQYVEAFTAILNAVKDDKEILKEVLTTKFHNVTLLEYCVEPNRPTHNAHYLERLHYFITGEGISTVKREYKEPIKEILDSAREGKVLEYVLVVSGIKKNLAKELSTQGDNDTIIKALQQNRENQKAQKRGVKVGIAVALVGLILAAVFVSWIVALATVFTSAAAGYGVYKFSQPSTKMLGTDANQDSAKPGINAKEQTV